MSEARSPARCRSKSRYLRLSLMGTWEGQPWVRYGPRKFQSSSLWGTSQPLSSLGQKPQLCGRQPEKGAGNSRPHFQLLKPRGLSGWINAGSLFLSLPYHSLSFLSFPISYILISPLNLYQICDSKESLEIQNMNLRVRNVRRLSQGRRIERQVLSLVLPRRRFGGGCTLRKHWIGLVVWTSQIHSTSP